MNSKDQPSILEQILAQRKLDVESAKSRVSLAELKTHINDFPLINFYDRSQRDSSNRVAVMAEVKRASPSKGLIAPNINAAEQGIKYARAGANVISCLTEPTWFKGTLDDMKSIRVAIDSLGASRPALLRKDFLFDEYQIYEARAYGADSLLLIVATFFGPNTDEKANKELLSHLIAVSRSLGMEPLIEVNSDYEMNIALELGSKVIGINNRNLHTFSVDMNTTARLVGGVKEGLAPGVRFAALSGINSRDDVVFFEGIGVDAVLVGEALMRAEDPAAKINELKGVAKPLVKICGLLEPSMAIATAEAGADFIGLVFAANSRRKVSLEKAQEIVNAINEWKLKKNINKFDVNSLRNAQNNDFSYYAKEMTKLVRQSKPVVVGVFSDNSEEEVNELATKVPLDLIQLSGHEGFDAAKSMVLPTVKAIHVSNDMTGTDIANMISTKPNLVSILLDTKDAKVTGGTGKAFDWNIAKELSEKSIPFFLAGGLDPTNIHEAVSLSKPFAVDVSSGVETDGKKDLEKIRMFINNA